MNEPQQIRDLNHEGMNQNFVRKMNAFLAKLESVGKGMSPHETFRTDERQEYLIASGASRVKRSNHQDGLAADLHFNLPPNFPSNSETWRDVALIAKDFGIDCGGLLWNGFDWNHFQDDGSPFRELIVLPDWQVRAITWATENGVSNGERPNDPITRVEVMEMFRKFAKSFNIN